MKTQHFVVAAVIGFGVFTASLFAHHSVAASHDTSRIVTIKGTVTKVEWRNPHTWITLSVKNLSGDVVVERVEIAGPGQLIKSGFDQAYLKIGDAVTIEAWMPKDDPIFRAQGANGRTLILSDARRFDVGDKWGM